MKTKKKPSSKETPNPTTVCIEITAEGYKIAVYAGLKLVSERHVRMLSRGHAEATKQGDIFDDIPDRQLDGFCESVSDISMRCFEIASQLHQRQP